MRIAECNAPVSLSVQRIMAQKGLKQKAVASKAGYTSQALTDMLNGRKIMRPSDISRLIVALGVTPNELFSTTENKPRAG